MNTELLTLGGYGQFVWPAFVFAFLCCFSLYLKTKKELNKQEKLFLLEYKELSVVEVKIAKGRNLPEEILSDSLTN